MFKEIFMNTRILSFLVELNKMETDIFSMIYYQYLLCSGYDTKPWDCEAPVLLMLWGM